MPPICRLARLLVIGSSAGAASAGLGDLFVFRNPRRDTSKRKPSFIVRRSEVGVGPRSAPPSPPRGAAPAADEGSTGVTECDGRDFSRALFRGMTLPFPMLRKLLNFSSRGAGDERVGFSTRECLLAIGAYLGLGVFVYSSGLVHSEPWSPVDALYFSVVTFTTVG